MASRGEYIIVYGSKHNDIESATFIRSLSSITTLIQEINHDLGTGKPLDIRIKAQRPGSFEVLVSVLGLLQAAQNLLTTENFTTVKEIMKSLAELLSIRRALTAKKPAEVVEQQAGGIVLRDSHGNCTTYNQNTYNLYLNNHRAQKALEENFESLENDSRVGSFKILDKKRLAYFEATRKDFQRMAGQAEAATETATKRSDTKHTEVTILRPSFKAELTWDIVYGSIKVPARLGDEEFQKKIARGEEFRAGDVLECDLQINQVLDPVAKVYVNKSYRIVKVHGHRKAAEQMPLKLDR